MQWPDMLMFQHSADGLFRMLFVILVGTIVIVNSTLFEAQYGDKLIDLYTRPWWRILVVLLVIAGAVWCPRVGIVIALAVFFYLNDMESLVTPLGVSD